MTSLNLGLELEQIINEVVNELANLNFVLKKDQSVQVLVKNALLSHYSSLLVVGNSSSLNI